MKNNYWKLTQTIHTPAGLNDRVLFEARRQSASGADAAPGRRAPRSAFRRFLRGAVCAACALVLVLGGFHLRPASDVRPSAPNPVQTFAPDPSPTEGPKVLSPVFGLTAYAAGAGNSYAAQPDGSIAFSMGEGMFNPGEGDFTGCLFQITGEDIASVRLSIDRGGLYRYQLRENLTDEQIDGYRQAMAEGRLATAAISQLDDGTWYMPEMTPLGGEVEEAYDPEAHYGFWLPPEDSVTNTGLGITVEAQMDADFFDGAALRITITSTEGAESSQVYRLHSGALRVEWGDGSELTVLPELAGPDEPFVYGIYAVPED